MSFQRRLSCNSYIFRSCFVLMVEKFFVAACEPNELKDYTWHMPIQTVYKNLFKKWLEVAPWEHLQLRRCSLYAVNYFRKKNNEPYLRIIGLMRLRGKKWRANDKYLVKKFAKKHPTHKWNGNNNFLFAISIHTFRIYNSHKTEVTSILHLILHSTKRFVMLNP